MGFHNNESMVYIIILLILLFLAYNIVYKSKVRLNARRGVYCSLAGMMFFSYYLLKDNTIFPDIDDYFYTFKRVSMVSLKFIITQGSPIEGQDPDLGYLIYNKLLSLISTDYYILIFANSAIVLAGYMSFIKRYSGFLFMSMALFLLGPFYHSLFIYRQYIAIALCLFSVSFILNRKLIHFLLLVLLAATIHKTAVVFLLLYPLYYLKIGKIYLTIMLFLTFVAISIRTMLVEYAILFIGVSEVYTKANEVNGGETSYTFFIINAVIMAFVFFFGKVRELREIEKLMFDSLVLVLIIDLAAVGLDGTIAGRLAAYFSPCNMILLPNICARLNRGPFFRAIVVWGILACFLLTFIGGFAYGFSF